MRKPLCYKGLEHLKNAYVIKNMHSLIRKSLFIMVYLMFSQLYHKKQYIKSSNATYAKSKKEIWQKNNHFIMVCEILALKKCLSSGFTM